MTDEQLEQLYTHYHATSHLAGLKAVFEVGVRSVTDPDETMTAVQRAESNRSIAAAKDLEDKRLAAEANQSLANRMPAELTSAELRAAAAAAKAAK